MEITGQFRHAQERLAASLRDPPPRAEEFARLVALQASLDQLGATLRRWELLVVRMAQEGQMVSTGVRARGTTR